MQSYSKHAAYLILTLVTVLVAGCGAPQAEVNPKTEAQFKVLGILYGKYMGTTRGKAPASEEQFIAFLNTKKPSWEKIVSSADQLLISPRDNQPLTVLYGAEFAKQNNADTPWVAYEQTGVDGMRHVVSVRGGLKLMDDEQFQSLTLQ